MTNENKLLIKNLSIWGAIFVVVFGTLTHFLYEFSNNNYFVGLITPVNESVWEHMKLAFTPLLIFAIIDYRYLKNIVSNYLFALMKEIFFGIAFIIAMYYLYTSFSQEGNLVVDISSFVVAIILSKWIGYQILTGRYKKLEFKYLNVISASLIVGLFIFFVYATINPPQNNLFVDPITNTFGIYQK